MSRFDKYKLPTEDSQWSSETVNTIKVSDGPGGVSGGSEQVIKRRTIPTQLIKRTRKTNEESLEESEKSTLQTAPFQAKRKQSSKMPEQPPAIARIDSDRDIYNDRPPPRSLFDFNRPNEDEVGSSLMIDQADFEDLEDRPDDYQNAFNRYPRRVVKEKTAKGKSGKSGSKSSSSVGGPIDSAENDVEMEVDIVDEGRVAHKIASEPQRCAVIVYGFSDSNFDLIVNHFAKFGVIMEDFHRRGDPRHNPLLPLILRGQKEAEAQTGKKGKKGKGGKVEKKPKKSKKGQNGKEFTLSTDNYPIFIGPTWVKITYNNPSSAVRALRENNSKDDQGSVIGVVPYTKQGLEALLKRPISADMDVGGGLANLQLDATELEFPIDAQGIGETLKKVFVDSGAFSEDADGKKTSSGVDAVRLKDGTKLINTAKNQKKKNDKVGFWQSSAKFLFGTGEI